jgi:hypothetical protein
VYRAEETVSGRMTATFSLPCAARGRSADIADSVRSNWVTEIDTDPDAELPPPAGVLVPAEELLHAAAAGHKPSDTDAASPFLAHGLLPRLA